MKKLCIKSALVSFCTLLVFESTAKEDFEYKVDSKFCKVEDYKQRGFDFFTIRDEAVKLFQENGNIFDLTGQIKNVGAASFSNIEPPGEEIKVIDFEYHDDDPFEVLVYRIVYHEKYDKDNKIIESWSRSSCKIKLVTLPDILHGRWVGWIASSEDPYRKGTQIMELSTDRLSWVYDTNYLFSLPREKQKENGDHPEAHCQCRFNGVITSAKDKEGFTDLDYLDFGSIIPDYKISYRLTNIELIEHPQNSEKCPEFIAEANKQDLNNIKGVYLFADYDYMRFGQNIFLQETSNGRLRFSLEKISFRPDEPEQIQ